jgi:hypothetical protein
MFALRTILEFGRFRLVFRRPNYGRRPGERSLASKGQQDGRIIVT